MLNILLQSVDKYLVVTGLPLQDIDWYFSKWIIKCKTDQKFFIQHVYQ